MWTNCGGLCNGVKTAPDVKWVGCYPTYCNSSNSWFTLRAEWLAENDTWGQQFCPLGACWIEAGWWEGCLSDGSGHEWCSSATTNYYWADSRPCGGGYHVQLGNPISPDYNTWDSTIIQTAGNNGSHTCGNNDQWKITIFSGGSGGGLNGLSTYNQMEAATWEIGLEVSGNQGNAASADDMIGNYFWPQGGSWQATTSSGNKQYSDSPASGGWATAPAPGNNGGDFYNTCSCNHYG